MAAPKKPAGIRLTVPFTIRLSPIEYALLKKLAKDVGEKPRVWARKELGLVR